MNNKIFSIVTTSLACVVMGGALVYYNFIDKVSTDEKAAVGSVCSDFSVQTIERENGEFVIGENYTLSENQGKVRIINFWATWCSGCIQELPEFSEFAIQHPEVDVIALAGSSGTLDVVLNWLNGDGWKSYDPDGDWREYAFQIGYIGTTNELYTELGGKGSWPITLIVDQEGEIVFKKLDTVSLSELESVVLPLLEE